MLLWLIVLTLWASVIGLLVLCLCGMSKRRPQFSLRLLFLWITMAAAVLGFFTWRIRVQRLELELSNYGNRRFTRAEAEAIAGRTLDSLPDEEFKKSHY